MPSQKNIDIVANVTEKIEKSQGIYFTKYTGLGVVKITSLRKSFTQNSVEFNVIKNTLTKLASKNAGLEDKFDDILKGQVGIAFSEDPVAPAKVIKDFNDEIVELCSQLSEKEKERQHVIDMMKSESSDSSNDTSTDWEKKLEEINAQ